MSDLSIEFADKEIRALGGIILLEKMMERMGFIDFLAHTPLPQPGSNRGYYPVQIILQFLVSVWCGANRYGHLEVTRFDSVIQQLFGWEQMAGNRAFVRFFEKIRYGKKTAVFFRHFTVGFSII